MKTNNLEFGAVSAHVAPKTYDGADINAGIATSVPISMFVPHNFVSGKPVISIRFSCSCCGEAIAESRGNLLDRDRYRLRVRGVAICSHCSVVTYSTLDASVAAYGKPVITERVHRAFKARLPDAKS